MCHSRHEFGVFVDMSPQKLLVFAAFLI